MTPSVLDADRTPVIVAVGQAESRDLSLGPIELAEAAGVEAFEAASGLRRAIERITVIGILSRRGGQAPASTLARRLGLEGARRETTAVGGNGPQAMVERAAADIADGRLAATLIVGAEAVRSTRMKPSAAAEKAESAKPSGADKPVEPAEPDPVIGDSRPGLSPEEHSAGLYVPVQVYPLFESVLATRAGRSPAAQREHIGRVMAPFTEVAAQHPHAWFPERLSAAEIATISPDNRLVAEPYLKRMVAFLGAAQSAALVVTSLARARSAGLGEGAMFVWSAASATEVWNPVARPDLGRSAGFEAAAEAALEASRVSVADVTLFDLYSCFPSAVQMAAAGLGLSAVPAEGQPRLTVTGGLPYFGGPGNNYSAHAIATMFDRLREDGGGTALVSAVGWYMTKHSVGIYGSDPSPRGFRTGAVAEAQQQIDSGALPYVAASEVAGCLATVDASTVLYDREGRPESAPVIATTGDGRRVALAAAEGELASVAGHFLVGARIVLEPASRDEDPPRYRVVSPPT